MSIPRINPNDPKWTAYVLGELDEADRASIERLLESSGDARALVGELKATVAMLEEAMASESSDVLTAGQKAALHRAADADRSRWLAPLSMRWSWGLVAVAAAVLVAVVVQLPRQSPAPAVRDAGEVASAPGAGTPAVQTPNPTSTRPDVSAPPDPPVASSAERPPARPPTSPTLPAAAASPAVRVEERARRDTSVPATTLTGSVRDSSGSSLPGVRVEAANLATGTATSTVTDAMGRYTFGNIEPGQSYRLTASLPGFRSGSADIRPDPGGNADRDFVLAVGSVAETVTVTGETPPVDVQTQRRASSLAKDGGFGVAVPSAAAPSAAPAAPTFRSVPFDTPGRGRVGDPRPSIGTESYARVSESAFVRASQEPLATFSIDVDTASYSNVRRFLSQNQLPPADAVRIEELVNYFTYDYARPSGSHPIGASMEVADAPWNPRHRLVRIGIKAREIDARQRPASNLVFLIDVSGSMDTPQKLPLVKSGLKMLVDQLGENDVVSIVVYASATGLALSPTSGERKQAIAQAIDNLQAGGSTNGGAGIQLAYRQATANFIHGGVNRVILVTDGDFNVGLTSQAELTTLIEERARSGVFLSVLGFGMGNLKDSTMERLADTGNGHYAYIDSLSEARKVLVEEMSNTLVTVAKDVKIQVDFNPGKVEAYRLIGYENRLLRPEDFNNDLKDAGDMGAGHTVTALFEIVPRGGTVPGPSIDPSVFQPAPRETPPPPSSSSDLLVLRVRYKRPEASDSTRLDVPLPDRRRKFSDAGADFRFAASVAGFGMILTNSQYRGEATLPWVLETAAASRGQDRGGYRDEFVSLVQKAMVLRGEQLRD